MNNQLVNNQSVNNQLVSKDLVTLMMELIQPESKDIYIQVHFWRTPELPLPHHKGSDLHPAEGGDMKGRCHFLGTYDGAMPKSEVLKALINEMRGKSREERIQLLSQLDTLRVYYPELNGGKGDILPVLKGSSVSFFSTWEDHQFIDRKMDELGVNAISFRVKVPQVARLFKGIAREDDMRPLFAATFYDISFKDINEEDIAIWNASETLTLPVIIPSHLENHPEIIYQREAMDKQQQRGAEAGLRNKRMLRQTELPRYLQQQGGKYIPTVASSSLKVDASSMALSRDPILDL